MKDILTKDTLLQKQDTDNKIQSKLMWIHYFKLRTVVASKMFVQDLRKGMTDFEKLLEREDSSTKHKLSVIYQMLLRMYAKCLNLKRDKWSIDCNKQFADNKWTEI